LPDARGPSDCADPALLPSTCALLVEGGDQRIATDPLTGVNRYGCPPRPDPDLAAFGSSTASAISVHALDAAERLRERLVDALGAASPSEVYEREVGRIRDELTGLCGLASLEGLETILAASGTDVHMLAAQLAAGGGPRPALVIQSEAAETGGGVPAALCGFHYGACTPFEAKAVPGEAICERQAPELAPQLAHVAARPPTSRPRSRRWSPGPSTMDGPCC
jgi:hypothetical protein